MATPAIEVVELTRYFRKRVGWFRSEKLVALESVSFSISCGESFGIIGPNGSGKSTLLRILSTVLLPSSGTAAVGGHPITHPARIKALIGVVPSDPKGFASRLSGRQNLEFFAALYSRGVSAGNIRNRVDQLLQRVGLAEMGCQEFWTYSTGQRQRLSIARALLHDPPILLLDEPTKGLDPWMAHACRRWVREELVDRMKKTVLIASHLMEDIERMCDRAILLRRGRLVWEGDSSRVKDLFEEFQEPQRITG